MKRGYKQTEVGVIPEEWETPTILGLSRQIIDYRGRTPKKLGMDWGGGDIPALSAGNVRMGFIDFSEECYFGSQALYKRWMTRGALAKDDIVFTTEAPLGNVALIPDDRKYILSQRTVLLQIDPEQASSRFIFQLMLSAQFQRVLADYSSGSTAKGIQRKKFEQLKLARPPLAEQRAIAEALSDVDALLDALDRFIAKKRDLKQAAMQQLLTGRTRLPGFSKKGFSYKQSEVGIIPEDWAVATLAEMCTFENGDRGKNYPSPASFSASGVPFVNAGHVAQGQIECNELNYITRESYDRLGGGKFKPGDILFCLRGSLGKFGVVSPDFGEGAIASSLVIVRPQSGAIIREFLGCYFSSNLCAQMIEKWSGGAAQPNLGAQDLARFAIPLPPTAIEQTAIAEVLSDMDAELAALQQRREKTRALKQGMMQELLTGKTRLDSTVTNVVPLLQKPKAVTAKAAHNWHINEAVVISVLTKHFGSERWPLGRKRYTKLSYLLHRHVEKQTQGYLKKAAGPYNPATKYKGPEAIALKNRYVRHHARDEFIGFVSFDNIAEAENYFAQWYGNDVLTWMEQFRRKTNDDLELLTTVDMAMEDLRKSNRGVDLKAVKEVIRNYPEWEAKLTRSIFSDSSIKLAIGVCSNLFGL